MGYSAQVRLYLSYCGLGLALKARDIRGLKIYDGDITKNVTILGSEQVVNNGVHVWLEVFTYFIPVPCN